MHGLNGFAATQVPTLEQEFGGVRVIIKREIFHAIQNGSRIDPKNGRLIKAGDRENDREKPFTPTPGQEKLISIIKKNDRVTTDQMREELKVSISTVNRDITALKEAHVLIREGGDNGGGWIILES